MSFLRFVIVLRGLHHFSPVVFSRRTSKPCCLSSIQLTSAVFSTPPTITPIIIARSRRTEDSTAARQWVGVNKIRAPHFMFCTEVISSKGSFRHLLLQESGIVFCNAVECCCHVTSKCLEGATCPEVAADKTALPRGRSPRPFVTRS